MKNKKEVSEKVKAILRDGRESKLYQHVIADMHGVCQAQIRLILSFIVHSIALILCSSFRVFKSLIVFHIDKAMDVPVY
jgi:hypothetical protein